MLWLYMGASSNEISRTGIPTLADSDGRLYGRVYIYIYILFVDVCDIGFGLNLGYR